MAATKTSALDILKRYYDVLSLEQPTSSVLDAMAARVDSGTATLGEVLKTLYQSPTVAMGPAADAARLFFLVFDRAPDAALYDSVMEHLRAGGRMEEVAAVALEIPGLPLSNAGAPSHASYVSALLQRAIGVVDFGLAADLTGLLDNGITTRAQMLAMVASKRGLAVAPPERVETALIYLAAAGREANTLELNTAVGTTDGRIIDALAAAGLSATGGNLALSRVGNTLKLYGDMAGDVLFDAAAGVYKLGGKTVFKVFYSPDGGLSGSIVDFHKAMVVGVTDVDASSLVGKGKFTLLANPAAPLHFQAPAAGAVATGSSGADWLVGSDSADTFYLTAGGDWAIGGLGDDKFVLPASTVFQAGSAPVTITDFGNGKDVLDFTRLLNKSVDIAKLTAVLADAGAEMPVINGSVTLVENNGVWVTGAGVTLASRQATAQDVAALFGPGELFRNPTAASKSVVITADTRSSADVWLVLNSTGVTQITDGTTGPQEVFHVAHLDGSWNVTLVGVLPVVLP